MRTIREDAAIAAMQGLLAISDRSSEDDARVPKWAVLYADALVAELERAKPKPDPLAKAKDALIQKLLAAFAPGTVVKLDMLYSVVWDGILDIRAELDKLEQKEAG